MKVQTLALPAVMGRNFLRVGSPLCSGPFMALPCRKRGNQSLAALGLAFWTPGMDSVKKLVKSPFPNGLHS